MGELRADGEGESSRSCPVCGTTITDSHQRRVVSSIEDGQATHTHFCSTDCLDERLES
ncbi:hypothetical protein ACLI4U_17030 [Natrialbaceae archaeon A-CW2]|uniref:DUF7576 family protein n=1 Tax=Natronosalvus amylolyticus TaxID=2961994 RepID=UPI0020CA25E5|nr:hypothetical protein [Natronosalvus amylolyticus]